MKDGTKRQRYNSKKNNWVISEWRHGRWNVITQRDEKKPGVNISKKPQFRG